MVENQHTIINRRLPRFPEINRFKQEEKESDRLFHMMKRLGIWQKMENIGRREPASRCADLASNAAIKLNELSVLAGSEPLVSPKVTYLTGLLFKAGQVIDDEMVVDYHLNELDPRILNLYRYPAYAPERTIQNSRVIRLALLLHKLNFPHFAELILHGPHPKFFEEAELPNILVALANANLALGEDNIWHSYLNPGVGLLSISPYAIRSDELEPSQAKDFVDRARMVAINTTLQHTLLMNANITFSDKSYELNQGELLQRWKVIQEVFKQLGLPFPKEDSLNIQDRHAFILKTWMKKYSLVSRLQKKQAKSHYPLFDHSRMVAELLEHLGKQINGIAQQLGEKTILNEKYLYNIGLCHDVLKSFDDSELLWLRDFKKFGAEFEQTFPSEVVARGRVSLTASHDARLYAWLRHFEESILTPEERDRFPSMANDFLSAPYHLNSLIPALLSYSDMAVNDREDEHDTRFEPDITNRFLFTTKKYISDPDTALNSYAKLMTVAASLSSYLGIPLPINGSKTISKENLQILKPSAIIDKSVAAKNLGNISRVLTIFGVAVPKELRKFEIVESE